MKILITVWVMVLAVTASLSWNVRQRLATARETHSQLAAQVARHGIASDPANPANGIRAPKRERENRDAMAKRLTADLVALAKEMDASEKNGGPPHEANQKRFMAVMESMMTFDPAQMKILIAELRADNDLKDITRREVIALSVTSLAGHHPQAALTLFAESFDLLKDLNNDKHIIASSLASWAKYDPPGAIAWLRVNNGKFPGLITTDAKCGLIAGASIRDPKLAFQLVGELGLKESDNVIGRIVSAAETPEARTVTLAAMRDYLATLKIDNPGVGGNGTADGCFMLLARSAAADGFKAASQWAASAQFTPAELERFCYGLNSAINPAETGQWIRWAGATLPPDKASNVIRSYVCNWTQGDYQAAGKWLASTPDGPVKNTAVQQYAETVSRYEPETAAQWALTLPPGKDRDATLKQIYHNWPKTDPSASEAAEAFAKEHGIK